jgi:PAS domain S-box-containing protein
VSARDYEATKRSNGVSVSLPPLADQLADQAPTPGPVERDDVRELCELAALICDAPVAGAQLIGPDGTVYSAWHGVAPTATPIDDTPCAQVLASGRSVAIDDLNASAKPDGGPWELGGLRAYAGVPVVLDGERPVGALCVLDSVVRRFEPKQLRALDLLARQVARGIQLIRQTRATERATSERAIAIARLGRIEQRFHALVESSPLAIFALDHDAEPVFVSDGCAILFGTAESRYEKTGWIPAVHEADRARATAQWAKAVGERTSIDLGYRIYDASGEIRELVVRAAAIRSERGEFDGWVGTVNDVTEQAQATRALGRARNASERARADVEARNAELQQLARTKDTFLAAISHELRTPLTSITTFLELLAAEDDLSEQQQHAVAVIARNAERLERLVTDLLNIKEAPGSVETTIEAVELRELTVEAAAAAALRAADREIELTVDEGPPVWGRGDAKRLAQVIDGLLDNALKFTPAGGRIAVRVDQRRDGAEIEIVDSGVGIAEDERERVFDRFYQGSAGRASGSGSGLGLAIARRLLDAQGARIEARAAPGGGTRMLVVVSSAPACERVASTAAVAEAG